MKTRTLLLLTMVLSLSFPLFSQEDDRIIYTDFESGNTFAITYNQIVFDINYDSTPDFRFIKVGTSGGDYNNIEMYDGWSVGTCMNDTDTIPLCNNWDSYWWMFYYEGDHYDYNFALKHNVEGVGLYYGWIRLRYQFDPEIKKYTATIYDMAYCTIPNYPLIFGQSNFTDVDENGYELPEAKLFPNPANDKLSLRISGDISCDNVMIYSIDGRLLKMQNDDFENIDVSDLSGGIYITKITLDNGITYTDKIVIK